MEVAPPKFNTHNILYKERNVGENPMDEKTAVFIGVIWSKDLSYFFCRFLEFLFPSQKLNLHIFLPLIVLLGYNF